MRTILVVALLLLAAPVAANEAQIRKALESKLPGKIEGIQPAHVAGLWEVHLRTDRGLHVVYTDATGAHLIEGPIHDLRTNRDLTEERLVRTSWILPSMTCAAFVSV